MTCTDPENFNTSTANTTRDASELGDIVVGTILSLCTALGSPSNLLSFLYFYNSKPRNRNGVFFKRVYIIITAVDFLICAVQFPVIQVLYNGRTEGGSLFGNTYFCRIWTFFYLPLMMTSIFLVAVLSVSRLLVLISPRLKLPLPVAWLAPGLLAASTAAALIAQCEAGVHSVVYKKHYGMCMATRNDRPDANNLNVAMPLDALNKFRVSLTVWAYIVGLPILPIAISFILSMVYLKRATDRAVIAHASTDSHRDASGTVVLVTFVYLLCNFPAFLYLIYVIYLHNNIRVTAGVTYQEFDCLFYPTSFVKNYQRLVVICILPVLNSAINPAIYLWRMKPFRREGTVRARTAALDGAELVRVKTKRISVAISTFIAEIDT